MEKPGHIPVEIGAASSKPAASLAGELSLALPIEPITDSGTLAPHELTTLTVEASLSVDAAHAPEVAQQILDFMSRLGNSAVVGALRLSWQSEPARLLSKNTSVQADEPMLAENLSADISPKNLSPDEADFQERLTMSARDLLLGVGANPDRVSKTLDILATLGVCNARDALLVGRGYLAATSQVTYVRLRNAIKEICPEEDLKLEPDIRQAARLCSDLSQVTAGVLKKLMYDVPAGWSVQDVLARSDDELARAVWGDKTLGRSTEQLLGTAREIRLEAQEYVAKFLAAQQAESR